MRRGIAALGVGVVVLLGACSDGGSDEADPAVEEPGTTVPDEGGDEGGDDPAESPFTGMWELTSSDGTPVGLLVLDCTDETCTSEDVAPFSGAAPGPDYAVTSTDTLNSVRPEDPPCEQSVPVVVSLEGESISVLEPNLAEQGDDCIQQAPTSYVGAHYEGSVDEWLAENGG